MFCKEPLLLLTGWWGPTGVRITGQDGNCVNIAGAPNMVVQATLLPPTPALNPQRSQGTEVGGGEGNLIPQLSHW